MSFFNKAYAVLSDLSGFLSATFTNGELDRDYTLLQTQVENDGASIKSTAQFLQEIKNNQSNGTQIVTLGASELHLGQIGGSTKKIYNEFTRPNNATAYTANDIVSNSTTGTAAALTLDGAARVAGGSGYITGLRLLTDVAITATRFRIHFGQVASAFSVLTDNDPNALTYVKASNENYLGYMDLSASQTVGGSSIAFCQDIAQRFPFKAALSEATGAIYCLVECLDGFTPSNNQKFHIAALIEQN